MMILCTFSVWSHQRRTIQPKPFKTTVTLSSQQTTHMCKPYLNHPVCWCCWHHVWETCSKSKIVLLITAKVLNVKVTCPGRGNGAFTLEHLVSPLLVLNFWQSPTGRFFQPFQPASTAATGSGNMCSLISIRFFHRWLQCFCSSFSKSRGSRGSRIWTLLRIYSTKISLW